ncbi:hypothetical protein H4582DRAFT_2059072 [Lactarius indigo]|nr:hypothetical protein H4582DRAFT_2059072 [Lactarius indigo]
MAVGTRWGLCRQLICALQQQGSIRIIIPGLIFSLHHMFDAKQSGLTGRKPGWDEGSAVDRNLPSDARPLPPRAKNTDFMQRGARAVVPPWCIRLPPVSEDKGSLPGELASSIARRGTTPGGLVAIG